VPDTAVERKTIATARRHPPAPKQLDAGPFETEVISFRLHLAAEGKAGRTLDTYTGAVRWFAAAHLLRETDKTTWEQVDRQDLQRWTVWLLGEYSTAYASNQFRAGGHRAWPHSMRDPRTYPPGPHHAAWLRRFAGVRIRLICALALICRRGT
jgi:hypothetical protein